MRRAKPPKKHPIHRPAKTPLDIFKTCHYTALAIIIRVLWDCYGWRHKRIAYFVEAYMSLLGETADRRNGVIGLIQDTKERTGIDVKALLDDLYGWD